MPLSIKKVLALPGTPTPDTLYLVKVDATRTEAYISDNTGTGVLKIVDTNASGAAASSELDPFLLMGVNNA